MTSNLNPTTDTRQVYSVTEKADVDGFYYIVDTNGKKIKIPDNLGYGKIRNKFVRVRRKYGRELRTHDAEVICNLLNNK